MTEPDWDPKWGPPPPPGSTDAVEALRREVPNRPAVLEVLVLVTAVSGLWSLGMMVVLNTAAVRAFFHGPPLTRPR